jgi:hypothetical protein
MCRRVLVPLLVVLFACGSPIDAINCSVSLLPYRIDGIVTADTLPSFADNSVVRVDGVCTLTVTWLRHDPSTRILFGFRVLPDGTHASNDSLLASVHHENDGSALARRVTHEIHHECRSTDLCNSAHRLAAILRSIDVRDPPTSSFDALLVSSSSFNEQSASRCYASANVSCPPTDTIKCARCEISLSFDAEQSNGICATCPSQTPDVNSIWRQVEFEFDRRSIVADQTRLWCQTPGPCNSLDNIVDIQRATAINFDFVRFFGASSSSSSPSMSIESLFICLFSLCMSRRVIANV